MRGYDSTPRDHAPNPPHGAQPVAEAAARKAAKADARKAARAAWNAAAPFPIASDLSLLSKAITAAGYAASPLVAARALVARGVPVFSLSPDGDKKPGRLQHHQHHKLRRDGRQRRTSRIGAARGGRKGAVRRGEVTRWI
jgi:hypothetical protein